MPTGEPDDDLAEWGRFEFRWLIRKSGYTMAQRGAWATIFAAVGLERRGGLISRQTAVGLIGARMVDFLVEHEDLERVDARDLRFHGWGKAQAPLERVRSQAAERQRRRRARIAAERDGSVTERDGDVTLSVSVSVTESESRPGESTETTTVESPPARAHEPAREDGAEDVWALAQLVEDLSGRPWTYSAGSRTLETLRADLRDFGRSAVERAMRAVPGPVRDGSKLVYAAHDLLVPFVDPSALAAAANAQQEAEAAAARERAIVAANAARQAELDRIAAQPIDPEAERIREHLRQQWGSGAKPKDQVGATR